MKIDHIEALLNQAVTQVRFVMNDTLRHVTAHLAVEEDHPSKAVVYEELARRLHLVIDDEEYDPGTPSDATERTAFRERATDALGSKGPKRAAPEGVRTPLGGDEE